MSKENKKKKEALKIVGVIAVSLAVIAGIVLFSVYAPKKIVSKMKANPEYLSSLSKYTFWSNTSDTAMPQYQTYNHVHDFLDECEIKDGSAVSKDGKTRKVLFLGFDGMRADALPYALGETNNAKTGVSGLFELTQKGGIYFAYCGGEKGTSTEQTTATSAGWTAHFTGTWGNKNGIKKNSDTKNLERKSFMLEYAEKGLSTALGFDWDKMFDVNYKEEIRYVMETSIPMQFCDIDRERNGKKSEIYNFVAAETPSVTAPSDIGLRDYVLERIEKGDDIICGLFDTIDSAGHKNKFGESNEYTAAVLNCDMYAHSILQAVAEREKNNNEEWLVVFANDHGGIGKDHGEQSLEERTCWIATNVPFDEKYFSKGYDGYNVK